MAGVDADTSVGRWVSIDVIRDGSLHAQREEFGVPRGSQNYFQL